VTSEDEIAISVVTVASGDDEGRGFQCTPIAKQVVIVDTSPDRPCLLRKNALGGNDFFRGDGEDFAEIVFVCCCCGCCVVVEEDTLHVGLHMLSLFFLLHQ
jgi:hypothetical protein